MKGKTQAFPFSVIHWLVSVVVVVDPEHLFMSQLAMFKLNWSILIAQPGYPSRLVVSSHAFIVFPHSLNGKIQGLPRASVHVLLLRRETEKK